MKGNLMSYDNPISLGKKIAAIGAAAVALFVPTATIMTTEKTPADKIAISYGGGPFEGNQFQQIVQPGSGLKFNGWFDKWYEYPVTLRNYIVSSAAEEGDKEAFDVIVSSDADGVEEQVELTLSFQLNQELIRSFHERLGLKYGAWDDDGWRKMLADNMRQPLNNAVNKALKEFPTDDIKKDPTVLEKLEKSIERELEKSLDDVLGADYFCGPTTIEGDDCGPVRVVVKGVTPTNPDVSKSYDDQKTSANGIQVSKNKAQSQIELAEGEKAAKDAVAEALTPEYLDYLSAKAQLECAQSADCTMIYTDGGGQLPALTIPVPGR